MPSNVLVFSADCFVRRYQHNRQPISSRATGMDGLRPMLLWLDIVRSVSVMYRELSRVVPAEPLDMTCCCWSTPDCPGQMFLSSSKCILNLIVGDGVPWWPNVLYALPLTARCLSLLPRVRIPPKRYEKGASDLRLSSVFPDNLVSSNTIQLVSHELA